MPLPCPRGRGILVSGASPVCWPPDLIKDFGMKLFVLYTGGTIGMLQTAQGLAPAGGFDARMREHLNSLSPAVEIDWQFHELLPLLDSANMTQANWLAMREVIVDAGATGGP